jgi:hypothetical protein
MNHTKILQVHTGNNVTLQGMLRYCTSLPKTVHMFLLTKGSATTKKRPHKNVILLVRENNGAYAITELTPTGHGYESAVKNRGTRERSYVFIERAYRGYVVKEVIAFVLRYTQDDGIYDHVLVREGNAIFALSQAMDDGKAGCAIIAAPGIGHWGTLYLTAVA